VRLLTPAAARRGTREIARMSPARRPAKGHEGNQLHLPLHADPVAGALIATFLLAVWLAGPIGLVLALIVWAVVAAARKSWSGRDTVELGAGRDDGRDRGRRSE